MSLNKNQAISLIKKIDYKTSIKKIFINELETSLFDKHKSFASNPLLLTIMLLTYEDHASIPEKLYTFYEQAFITLFNRHDATKDGYQREILSNLSYEDFKKVLSYFCFKSFFHNDFSFTETKLIAYIEDSKKAINQDFVVENYKKDLINSVCMITQDGLSFSFIHRSFQEYFSALYTMFLTDDVQSKLIINWYKGKNSIFSFFYNGFFGMLNELEEHRFNKNIIIPLLVEIKNKYIRNKYSDEWILEYFYFSFDFDNFSMKDENELGLGCILKNHWSHKLIDYICKKYNYEFTPLSASELEEKK